MKNSDLSCSIFSFNRAYRGVLIDCNCFMYFFLPIRSKFTWTTTFSQIMYQNSISHSQMAAIKTTVLNLFIVCCMFLGMLRCQLKGLLHSPFPLQHIILMIRCYLMVWINSKHNINQQMWRSSIHKMKFEYPVASFLVRLHAKTTLST